jgi:hypothetical protein
MINGHRIDRDRFDVHGVNGYSIDEYICGGVVFVRVKDNRSQVTEFDVDEFDWCGFDRDEVEIYR